MAKRKNRTFYYHLTDPANIKAIRREGIKPTDGMIFVITDSKVANTIARDQIFLSQYALYQIDRRGITGSVRRDNVTEFSAGYQRIIHTKHAITRPFISLIGVFSMEPFKPTEWDYEVYQRLGLTREQIDGNAAVMEWSHTERQKQKGGESAMTDEEIMTEANRRLKHILEGSGSNASD